MKKYRFITLFVLVSFQSVLGQTDRITDADELANDVKKEFLHSWNAYKKYAWGSDGVQPLSKTPYNWHQSTLLLTPVDAFSTMLVMGLDKEAKETQNLILSTLSFDKDISVKNFEITIRVLGGLLSAYQTTGDKKFLTLADDLGKKLLPVFNSPTGLPHVFINLKTGAVSGDTTNPAEAGTLLIEFGTLAKLTGKPIYYEKAKKALVALYQRRSSIGLVGQSINVNTGEWTSPRSHLGGLIDSYYEYLYKCWKLFGDEECRTMWLESISVLNKHLPDTVNGKLWYARVDMNTGKKYLQRWGGLEAFFPGLLAYTGDVERAKQLQESNYYMWTHFGIEPEAFNYSNDTIIYNGYPLRPEIMESAYYLYKITGDTLYQQMGKTFFESLKRYCRTEHGYAELDDVVTKKQRDMMESFYLAETLKYLYLLFAPPETIDLNVTIFNTEAHPLRRIW
ncbi:MAG: glycoside hydrolase family 47 protein [Bacteroidota bacterium]